MRIGELLALEWSDIDFKSGYINVSKTLYEGRDYDCKFKSMIQHPKSKYSIRKIPMTKKLIILLKEIKDKAKTNYVIESRGKRQSLRSYQAKFKRLQFKIGVDYKSFHCLRHTFATRTIESGINIKTLSEILGHSSIKITLDRYVTITNEFKKKEIEKFDNYINKKCSPNNLLDELFY